ncbi:DarT1-associated NADAR antitoxin family protein [Falsibacillus pallidus]|uniref:Uncharacterized protein n=1 Tax=Falsibacillus pallidus TaxID=493781 RepID=A0A370GAX4_9BACI|nr:hypothetical protein [Falsibacillus pallidus]RDI40918.1 hypothetical protein DFR59_11161 [Falsibacillus pallidus]
MAERPVFVCSSLDKGLVQVKDVSFEWFPGFSVKQKQKSLESLHKSFKVISPSSKVLEISSKSDEPLGISLSAFNLMIKTKNDLEFSVETAFQASKVFDNGGPFLDLYEKTSREAKKDPRLKCSGRLLYFQFFGRRWDLEPKTFFYDWLYINALSLNKELSEQVTQYDAFTDIEFNPKVSINCQARSAALYVSLYNTGVLTDALSSIDQFKEIVFGQQITKKAERKTKKDITETEEHEQLSIFDQGFK